MSQEYIIADSRKLVQEYSERNLPKADIIITSPPYYDVKKYGQIESQIGYKQSYQDYLTDTIMVLQQCYEVSSDEATLWLVVDTIQRDMVLFPIPFDIQKAFGDQRLPDGSKRQTWVLRDIIIWNRSKNVPWNSKGHLKHEFEYILLFSKNKNYKYYLDRIRNFDYTSEWWLSYPERYHPNGRPPSNIWDFSIPIRGWGNGYQQHLCPFPISLVERILNLSSDLGDYVLDPFAGSGSVMAIADQMGRNGIGFDICEEYKAKYKSQVLPGVQDYWKTRLIEIEKVRKRAENFKKTNIKLRKIKAGIKLAKILKQMFNDETTAYIIMDGNESTISLLVLQSKINSPIQSEQYSTNLDKIASEYSIDVTILYKLRVETSVTNLYDENLFAYTADRIYRPSGTYSIPQILNDSFKSSYVFSNIHVDIQNPKDFISEQ